MKKEDFNQWKGFEEITIPQGKTIVLQVLGIVDDPLPENKGQKIIPNVNIRPTCTIFRDGKTYNMAAIENVDVLGNVTLSHIFFSGGGAGVIRLHSGNPEDERRWKYLSICDENESNTFRNQNIEAKFRVLDEEQEAINNFDFAKKVIEAKSFAFSADDSVIKSISKELKIEGNNTNDLRLKLSKLADTDPLSVLNTNKEELEIQGKKRNAEKELLDTFKKAVKDGLFKVDKENQCVTSTLDENFKYTYYGAYSDVKLLEYIRENHIVILDSIS